MSNVCTIFLRVFPEPGRSLREIQGELWKCVLDHGNSYGVEDESFDVSGGVLDLVYGRRSGPGDAVERVLFELSDHVSAVFIRYQSQHGEPDAIQQIDIECDRLDMFAWRPCCYAFDEIRVGSDTGHDLRIDASGTYLAINDRSIWRADPTGLSWLRSGRESSLASLDAAEGMLRALPVSPEVCARARTINLLHRGRLVHRAARLSVPDGCEPPEDGFMHYALDGWDNCADERFRSLEERSRGIPASYRS